MMPKNYRKDALVIFCLLAFCFAYFYQDSGWNGNSRFGMIYAIVQEGRLTIDDYYTKYDTQTGDKAFFNGHYYSDKAIGPAVVGAVFYAPLYWVKQVFNRVSQPATEIILTFLVIGLPSAIAGSLMYLLCLYISGSRSRAYLVTLAVALGTMYFPYSVIFFSHQFAAALLFSAFVMIFFLKEKPALWKNWVLFLIGSLLGWALISEFPTAAIILPLVIYYFFIIWKNRTYRHFRSIIMPFLGGVIPILLQLLYNKLCFGNYFSIAYSNLSDTYYGSAMEQGFMGLHWPNLSVLYYMTIHPTVGVFWQSPALILSFIGAVFLFRDHRYRPEAILVIWIIGFYFAIMSGYFMWWGGRALGPRHIIPVLPFFCVPLIFVPRRLTWPLVILSIISIGQMTIAAASNVLIPDWMVVQISTLGFFEYSNIYNYCLAQLIQGDFTRNLGNALLSLNSWSSLVPFLVVLVGTIPFFSWESLAPHFDKLRSKPA